MSQRPARRRGRGRRALLILLLLTVFGAAFLWWSNRSLQVDRFTYASPRLPAGFDGCVAVQLSDLHGALFGENNQDLIDAVRAENPDYIFLTGDLLDRYRRIDLIRDYIDRTEQRIERYNAEHGIAACERRINGLHQTNLGIFRAYLVRYLQQEVPVNQSMTLMVRQMQPTETGLPMELYFFTDTVVWEEYEGIQSDVFDHVLAVIPAFDLRVFQNLSSGDLAGLRAAAEPLSAVSSGCASATGRASASPG